MRWEGICPQEGLIGFFLVSIIFNLVVCLLLLLLFLCVKSLVFEVSDTDGE